MDHHSQTAAWQGDRPVVSKAVGMARTYQNPTISATDFAASIIVARFHLTPPVARLVVELATLGGGQSA